MKRKSPLRHTLMLIFAATALALVSVVACGKKGPPVPPDRPPLPKVVALTGHLDGDTVTLSWPATGADQGVQRYLVQRSDQGADTPDCKGCPLVFRNVGETSIDRDTQTVVFTDTVAEGAIYTYQVQAVGANGDFGPASDPLVIDRSSRQE